MQFKDSIHQYPQFATLGEPAQHKELILELQLFADVALIGTPSV
jgi:GTPase involved in cell partitioning and DNA repair